MCVARNLFVDPRLLPGGGATEMAIATVLERTASSEEGVAQWPRKALAQAFEVCVDFNMYLLKLIVYYYQIIPHTLVENCGANVIRRVTELRAKYHELWEKLGIVTGGKLAPVPETAPLWGINGLTGELMNVRTSEIWEPYAVKVQTFKSAVDSACMLLRIDDIVSGMKKKKEEGGGGGINEDAPFDVRKILIKK
jgi:T-complex protein 1 subunit gamma